MPTSSESAPARCAVSSDLPCSARLRKSTLVRQCPTRFGAAVDTTVTVRLDTQLKDDAERTLDSLGLSMSSAIRVFLTHVVAQKALPFPVQAGPMQAVGDVQEPLNVPLHVHIEMMLEEIAVISARLQQMEQAEQAPDKRKELREIGKAVRAMRFQFDPYNEVEVMAMVRKISQYAKAVQPAYEPAIRPANQPANQQACG